MIELILNTLSNIPTTLLIVIGSYIVCFIIFTDNKEG